MMPLCCTSIGLKICAADRPSCNETIVPAMSRAESRMRATVPWNTPTMTSPPISATSPDALAGSAGSCGPSTGVSSSAIASASSRRKRCSTKDSPKPGSSIMAEPTRAKISSEAKTLAGSNWSSMAGRVPLARDDAAHQRLRERDQRRQHEGQQQHERDQDDDHLRHEGQRHLLDLRQRLQEGDGEADGERQQHDRRAELERHDYGLMGEIDRVGVVHGARDA